MTLDDLKVQGLLQRIRDLKEICDAENLESDEAAPPVGYTPARWQLAMQSFSLRWPSRKTYNKRKSEVDNSANSAGVVDEADLVQFGPEWDLKCAQLELEELLKQQQQQSP